MILPLVLELMRVSICPRIKCDKPQAEISSFARTDSRGRLSPRLMISYDCSPPWKTDIAKAESGHC
jgi:hypothetical protein